MFSEEMIRLWTAALEDIRDRDDIYAVLLSGNGKAFCAGGDVKAMAAGDGVTRTVAADQLDDYRTRTAALVERLGFPRFFHRTNANE